MDCAADRARLRSLWGKSEKSLVSGIGVDCGHQTGRQTEFFQKYLGNRRQAVGGARRIGNDVMSFGIVPGVVDSHDNGDVRILRRSGNYNFTSPCGQMSAGSFPVPEKPGAFGHHIDTKGFPVTFFRIIYRGNGDGTKAYLDGVSFCFHHSIGFAVYRIVFQQGAL